MRRTATRALHARFQELISERLLAPLGPEQEAELAVHLARCARCREVERGFREGAELLRRLAPINPPRDLWARTAAALDRDVGRSHRRFGGERALVRPHRPRSLLVAALGISAAVGVVGSQLLFTAAPATRTADGLLRATPFDVPSRPLAFVGQDEEGLAVYRTDVSRVCPSGELDCTALRLGPPTVIHLARHLSPSSVAIHPRGDRAAIIARDPGGEVIYAVVRLPPEQIASVVTTPAPNASPAGPSPVASASAPPTTTVSATSSARPTSSPAVSASSSVVANTPTTVPSGSGAAPSPSAPAGTPSSTARATPPLIPPPPTLPRPSQTLARTPAASPSASMPLRTPGPPLPASATPSPTQGPGDSQGPRDSGGPGDSGGPAASPSPLVELSPSPEGLPDELQPILENVLAAGAPPAWSPDGSSLAFSAMPADGSRGPDIYLWQAGEEQAQRLTDDHRSYFASWSGPRIVISRVVPAAPRAAASEIEATTVVLDPSTREERLVPAAGSLWLPLIDPTGRYAAAWRGTLAEEGAGARPVIGGLYLVDWRSVDPFASRPEPDGAEASPTITAPTITAPTITAPTSPTTTSDSTGQPDFRSPGRSPGGHPGSPAAVRLPRTSAVATRTPRPSNRPSAAAPSQPTASPSAPETAPPAAPAGRPPVALRPIEPERDETTQPVIDWQLRWSDDGSAIGYWIADDPGGSWGHLTVLGVSRGSDRPGATLLGPTLARRAFTLGFDRVAWVAPTDDDPNGEIRVRTWGAGGSGTVRIRGVNVSGGLPGF